MKDIQSVDVWFYGEVKSATKFKMGIEYDNLESTATFTFSLISVEQDAQGFPIDLEVNSGNLTMSGTEYTSWGGSNDSAYDWGANKLNLTII